MSDIAIRVENLSKLYHIGRAHQRHDTLRDALAGFLPRISQINTKNKIRGNSSNSWQEENDDTIWALKDVSFEVRRGEVVGVIGRNGAGKSTLLKILSRITEPTSGRAEIHGRVGSLLEVGTGFHPELTGRENVYLNGAILGMRRAEIDKKFDEIVAFAEIEKFLDTPVKRYSSGMYVRLAFAVAAHLEPEILLVDEVLAVGDAAFQKKCLGKMGDVAKEGRTVLYVSHQMNSIRQLSGTCIWLKDGLVQMHGATMSVVSAYEAGIRTYAADNRLANTDGPTRFLAWEITTPRSNASNVLSTSETVTFVMMLKVNEFIGHGVHGITLRNGDEQIMWSWAQYGLALRPGIWRFQYTLPTLPLRPGVYSWHVSIWDDNKLLDEWFCSPELIVATSPQTHPRDEWAGVLNVPCEFKLLAEQSD
jgi:lipopolysaccharide transport system ATP-binding protein